MQTHLQTAKTVFRPFLIALGAVALLFGPVSGQSITVELAIGDGVCADFLPVDIFVSTASLAPNNTLGSATIDVLYDDQLQAPSSPGALQFNSTPYTTGVSLVDVNGPAVRYSITSSSVGSDFGETSGTDISTATLAVEDLCFENASSVADGQAASKSAVVDPSYVLDPLTISVGFFDSNNNSNNSGTIVDCRGAEAQQRGTIGFDCTLINIVPLPVELTDFGAIVDNGDVSLTWTTASETDNAGFSVEHAAGEAGTFEEIAFVEGAGTSLEARTYTHIVKGLDIGQHRFRLKQLDYDGAFEYSQAVEAVIELAGTHRLGAAYPNPFNPTTTFELVVGREQHVKIDIINALGQRVHRLFDGSMEANKPTNFTFQASMLPTGLYFYRAVGETFAQTRQVLLVK